MNEALLNVLQRGLPLTARPFAAIAKQLDLSEEEVLQAAGKLTRSDLVRRFGAIFDAGQLGYQSVLCAMQLQPQAWLESAAAVVCLHPGVTHCYERGWPAALSEAGSGAAQAGLLPNLWFTYTAPVASFEQDLRALQAAVAPHHVHLLPTVRRFKIDVVFAVGQQYSSGSPVPAVPQRNGKIEQVVELNQSQREVVRALQGDLPVQADFFANVARKTGLTEASLLGLLQDWQEGGLLRRIAVILRHRNCGFKANGMCIWDVPAANIVKTGQRVAAHAAVTHCYERMRSGNLTGNLYAMIHATEWQEAQELFQQITGSANISQGKLLFSLREFKKTSMRFFSQETV